MIICNKCGADMRFDPAKQKLVCDYCGNEVDETEQLDKYRHVLTADAEKTIQIEDNGNILDKSKNNLSNEDKSELESNAEDKYYEINIYKCPQCGAELYTTDETAATFCNYCGSSVLIYDTTYKEKPDYLIPFEISNEKCLELYKNKISKVWFIPKEMKEKATISNFRGIYMPYWIFNFESNSPLKFSNNETHRAGKYLYIQKYINTLDIKIKYSGIPFDSSSRFFDYISQSMSSFDISKAKEFDSHYLSGFYVDVGDEPKEKFESRANEIIVDGIKEDIKNFISKLTYFEEHNTICTMEEINKYVDKNKKEPKLGYMPVWFLAIKSKAKERISYVAVNGYTGEVAVDLPIDKKKYVYAILIVTILIFFVINLLPMITAENLSIIGIIFNIFGCIVLSKNLNYVYDKEKKKMPTTNNEKAYVEWLNSQNLKMKSLEDKFGSICFFTSIFLCAAFSLSFISQFWNEETNAINYNDIGEVLGIVFGILLISYMLAFFIVVPPEVIIESIINKRIKNNKNKIKKKYDIRYEMPFGEKFPYLIPNIIGVLICCMIPFFHVALDEVYYAIAIISCLLFAFSMLEIIFKLNKVATSAFPQFEKRGGDKE